jgi:outer membrane protein OmpA-like peptidoglycan-associated protein
MVLGTPLRKVPQELLKEGGALQMALGVAAQHPRAVELAAGFFGQILFDELQPSLVSILRSEAKAVLVMTGDSATNSVGAAGLLGSYGYIWTGDLEAYDVAPTARPDPEFVEIETSMSASDRWSVVRLQGDTLFDFAKWDIKSEAMALLRSLADHIKQKSPKRVQFNGYTDGIGKPHFNYNLSKKRAQAVADWLSSLGALNGCIVQIVPHGMDNPVQPNKLSNGWDNPYGRAMNRRVEIAIFS